MIEILKAGGVELQRAMHRIVEIAADACGLHAGGFGFQIQHLAKLPRLVESMTVAPAVGWREIVAARQHRQRKGGVGGNFLMA